MTRLPALNADAVGVVWIDAEGLVEHASPDSLMPRSSRYLEHWAKDEWDNGAAVAESLGAARKTQRTTHARVGAHAAVRSQDLLICFQPVPLGEGKVLATHVDVTPWTGAHLRALKRYQALHRLMHGATDVSFELALDGTFLSLHGEGCAELGYHGDDVGKVRIEHLVAPWHLARLGANLVDLQKNPGRTIRFEVDAITRAGAIRRLRLACVLLELDGCASVIAGAVRFAPHLPINAR